MSKYNSKYTGEQIDNAVGKALAIEGGYEETVVKPMLDVIVPAGQGGDYSTAPNGTGYFTVKRTFDLEVGKIYPVTINGKTFEVECYSREGLLYLGDYPSEEPYFEISYYPQDSANELLFLARDPDGQGYTVDRHITIDIPVEEKVIHTVDPKYLPAGGVGYEETVVNKLVDFVVPAGQGGSYGTALTVNDFPEIVPGDTYVVTVNGEPFTIVAITSGGDPCLGQQLWNDTSSPCFSITAYGGIANVIAHDPNGLTDTVDRHIIIEQRETTVHTIEPKFLPGVCLPVVDFTDRENGNITDEATIQLLDKLANSRMPIILKSCLFGAHHHSHFADCYVVDDGTGVSYASYDAGLDVTLEKQDGVWRFNVSSGA
jgi:hypothetical protein